MKASTVCALFLGTLFSTLDALPTNATSPENPSRQTFEFSQRFGQVEYFYSGSCDATTQYEKGQNSLNMDKLILDCRSETGSRPIAIKIPVNYLVYDTELSIQFLMRGGFPINYDSGANILDKLRDYFVNTPDLDKRPCRGSISVRGNVKFAFTFEKVPFLRVGLQPLASVRVEGNTWPSRPLPIANVAYLIQEADQYMSRSNPGDQVPDNVDARWGPLEGYTMRWEWSLNKHEVLTRLTWSESRLVLAAIRQYFHAHVTAKTVVAVEVQEATGWGACARVNFGSLDVRIDDPLSLNSTRIASSSSLNSTILSLSDYSASGHSSASSDSSVSTT